MKMLPGTTYRPFILKSEAALFDEGGKRCNDNIRHPLCVAKSAFDWSNESLSTLITDR